MAMQPYSIPSPGQQTVSVNIDSLRLMFILGTLFIAVFDDALAASN